MINCQLHQSDFLSVMRRQRPHSIDALIADPPYATTALPWDQPVAWELFWKEAERICKPLAVIALFSAQPFTTTLINSNRKKFRYELIWEKSNATGFLNANRRPLTSHENVIVFTADKFIGSTYNPQKTQGKPYKASKGAKMPGHYSSSTVLKPTDNPTGARFPRTVLHFAKEGKAQHPTQKPLDLMEWLVLTYSNVGDLILDPFMGSGSTGVAAVKHDRRFIGVDREMEYLQIAATRIDSILAGQAVISGQAFTGAVERCH